jgi:hypothetical protein
MPERVIGGKRYEVQALPARRQFRYLGRIQEIRRSSGFESPLDLPDEIIDGLLETATVDGKPLLPVIDEMLRGKMADMVEVVAFALEVNYSGFFSARADKPEPAPVSPAAPSAG